jgi:hypothetical protein
LVIALFLSEVHLLQVSVFPDLAVPPSVPRKGTTLGPDVLLRSAASSSDANWLSSLLDKVVAGRCLKIVALGGSGSAGSCQFHNAQSPTRATAWPDILAQLLQDALPCAKGRHSVQNLAKGGVCDARHAWHAFLTPLSSEDLITGWTVFLSARFLMGGNALL